MGQYFKPFAVPVILFLVPIGLSISDYQNIFVSGLLFGVAGFFGLFALLSHKALLKRFPWVLEWAPFLDPSGVYATPAQLTGNHISHKTFFINNIPYSGMIEGRTFEDCHILGPAVIHHSGQTSFYNCKHEVPAIPNPENTVYTVIPDHGILGTLPLNNCVFRRCKFSNISFVGNEQAGEIMKMQIRDSLVGRE